MSFLSKQHPQYELESKYRLSRTLSEVLTKGISKLSCISPAHMSEFSLHIRDILDSKRTLKVVGWYITHEN